MRGMRRCLDSKDLPSEVIVCGECLLRFKGVVRQELSCSPIAADTDLANQLGGDVVAEHIAVLGTGTMARGIAMLAALSGFKVNVWGRSQMSLDGFDASINSALARRRASGKLSAEESAHIAERILTGTDASRLGAPNLIIETVVEDAVVKRAVIAEAEKYYAPETLIASNTSSIPISELAVGARHPERIIGMHFMNPPHAVSLVEIIPSKVTREDVTLQAMQFALSLGRTPLRVPDQPGFVLNRLLFALLSEAMRLSESMAGDPATVDKAMKMGANHPMGPHELADLIGLDVCLAILKSLHSETHDPKYAPSAVLLDKVEAGKLGRKSREGFYTYD
jgi:3-hydroxybutyryl-CoA dehydrogenase